MQALLQSAASIAIAAGLAFAGWRTLRAGYADLVFRLNTLPDVRRATEIEPGNANWRVWLSELLEREGGDPKSALLAAAQLKPADSAAWIRLGLRAELEGDQIRAEHYLLNAAAADKLYEPRWTLANYYFRQRRMDRFWPWVKSSFEMAYGNSSPLFELCWRATPDPARIREVVPPTLLPPYLTFLLEQNRFEAAAQAALDMMETATNPKLPLLLETVTRLLDHGFRDHALSVWNSQIRHGWLPYEQLGARITNPDFANAPLAQGFDWRPISTPELSALHTQAPAGLRFTFTGRQPESCQLLWQYVPLQPQRKYRLRTTTESAGFATASGLRWRLLDSITGRDYLEKGESAAFTTNHHSLARLILTYQRIPGTMRITGSLTLRSVHLEAVP